MAVRHVTGNALVSPDQPKIALHVDKSFTALPVLAFPIRRDTWVERYCFVDSAPDKAIRRLVVVQFEHTLDGSAFRFVYPSRPPMTWGGAVYRHGAFVAEDSSEAAANPGLEVDRTRQFLEGKGYRVGDWWNIARLARVANADGKSEIIVFYEEAKTVPTATPPPKDDDNDLPAEAATALFARMQAAVTSD
jgi:hypothetical protein